MRAELLISKIEKNAQRRDKKSAHISQISFVRGTPPYVRIYMDSGSVFDEDTSRKCVNNALQGIELNVDNVLDELEGFIQTNTPNYKHFSIDELTITRYRESKLSPFVITTSARGMTSTGLIVHAANVDDVFHQFVAQRSAGRKILHPKHIRPEYLR